MEEVIELHLSPSSLCRSPQKKIQKAWPDLVDDRGGGPPAVNLWWAGPRATGLSAAQDTRPPFHAESQRSQAP